MKKEKKKNYSSIIIVFLLILSLIGLGSYFIIKVVKDNTQNEKVIDENALMIGTYKTSTDSDNKTYFNNLYIYIYNNGRLEKELKYATDDKSLVEVDYLKNMVFVDLTDVMSNYTNNIGIYFWYKTNPTKNYILVQTEYTGFPFISDYITINDSGLWAVNIPSKNDEMPEVSHSKIYKQNVFSWGL